MISLTPYDNGAYVIPAIEGTGEEYILYCSCSNPSAHCRWKSSEVMLCYVGRAAYERGYGTAHEVVPIEQKLRERWPIHANKYIDRWVSPRKNFL